MASILVQTGVRSVLVGCVPGVVGLWAAMAAAAGHGEPPPTRLDSTVKPSHYRIHWDVDVAGRAVVGQEQVKVTLLRPTSSLWLHAVDLELTEVRATSRGETVAGTWHPVAERELVELRFARSLPSGVAVFALAWRGPLRRDLRGLYFVEDRSPGGASVAGAARPQRYVATQFEPTDARRAFPCFDEPSFKARFAIEATVPAELAVISNGSVVSEVPLGGTGAPRKRVRFDETPPLSTYLVALAAGPFVAEADEQGLVPTRVWTTPAQRGRGAFALRVVRELLPQLEAYFGIPYPYRKLDLVAVPGFAAGAMENAGAIFFREGTLLAREEGEAPSSRAQLQQVAETVVHELAHQWFGNLVTMQWWDDLWLNEAFASWMERLLVARWRPQWQLHRAFLGARAVAMAQDRLPTAHPIRAPIVHPEEIEARFDALTYIKGAAVLGMLEGWLGPEVFRAGIRRYVARHREGNATAAALWSALEEEAGRPVACVARPWLERPGYPMVRVAARCDRGHLQLTLSQRRQLAAGHADVQDAPWPIPICFRQAERRTCALVTERSTTLPMEPMGCGTPVAANVDEVGYFQVLYDSLATSKGPTERGGRPQRDAVWRALSPLERIGLLQSTWAAVARSERPMAELLELMVASRGERDLGLVRELASLLEQLDRWLLPREGPSGGQYAAFVRWLVAPIGEAPGAEPLPLPSDDERPQLRAVVLELLTGPGRDVAMTARLARLWDEAQRGGAATAVLQRDPELRGAALMAAARLGDAREFEELLDRTATAASPDDRRLLLRALAAFEEVTIAWRVVERALSLGPPLRTEDLGQLFGRLLRNRYVGRQVWGWLQARWSVVEQVVPPGMMDTLARSVGELCSTEAASQLAERLVVPGGGGQSEPSRRRSALAMALAPVVRQTVDTAASCARWVEAERPGLVTWLHRWAASHPR